MGQRRHIRVPDKVALSLRYKIQTEARQSSVSLVPPSLFPLKRAYQSREENAEGPLEVVPCENLPGECPGVLAEEDRVQVLKRLLHVPDAQPRFLL
jgi:hypothetical protein